MLEYIREFSKYFLCIFMCIYTLQCYLILHKNYKAECKGLYLRQSIMLYLVLTAGYLSLFVQTQQGDILFFYALQMILLFAFSALLKMMYPEGNLFLLHSLEMLLGIGLLILCRLSMKKAVRQLIIAGVCLLISFAIPWILRKWKKPQSFAYLYGAIGILSLILVLLLGGFTHGSKLSYSIAGFTFQPSEFVKILYVLFIAAMYSKSTGYLNILWTGCLCALHVFVLVCSRDLGSALLFFVVYIMMTVLATKKYWIFLPAVLSGAGASILAYQVFTHVQIRVQAWKDPWSVIDKEGYQITQSLFALCSGGFFGLGLLKGTPQDIPYVETDFIFAAIVEELGVVFGICLLLVTLGCFLNFMRMSLHCKNIFWKNAIFGLGIFYVFQVFLTIGGGTKFIPLTGVTLPLVSYGGSSVFSTILLFMMIYSADLEMREYEGNN